MIREHAKKNLDISENGKIIGKSCLRLKPIEQKINRMVSDLEMVRDIITRLKPGMLENFYF